MPPDQELDEPDLDEIRSLTVEALAEMGKRTIRIEPSALVLEDEAQFSLDDIALVCERADRSDWPQIVGHYARAMAAPSALGAAELSDEEFLGLTRARLVGHDALDDLDVPNSTARSYSYARPLVPDRPGASPLVVLCHDLPDAVITLGDLHLKGRDLDAVWAAALANTVAEPAAAHDVLEDEGARIEVVRGDSFFTAAKALDFPALVAQRPIAHGVVFAVPFQQFLLLHFPRSAEETAISLNLMSHLAQQWHGQAVKPVSPDVFYWKDGVYQQITEQNEEGEIVVHVENGFFDTLNAIVESPGSASL